MTTMDLRLAPAPAPARALELTLASLLSDPTIRSEPLVTELALGPMIMAHLTIVSLLLSLLLSPLF
jgi:hypothetical protein